jgi:VCBS repeat-containing protein
VNYAVTDGDAVVTKSTTVTINGANDGPTAVADSQSGSLENNKRTANVLANDTDPDAGDTLSLQPISGNVTVVGPPAVVAALNGLPATTFFSIVGGQIQFTPGTAFDLLGEGQSANITMTYGIVDGSGATSTSTLTLSLFGENDAPVLGAVTLPSGTTEDSAPVTIDLLQGATDAENSALNLVGLSVTASNGQEVLFSRVGGAVTIVPSQFNGLKAGETVTIALNYGVTDGEAVVTAVKTFTIQGVNDAPVASAGTQALTATEDDAFLFTLPAGTFTDVDGDALTYSLVGAPAWMSIDAASGVISGTPANGDVTVGTVAFTVQAVDGNGGTVTKAFSVAVANANDGPTLTGVAPLTTNEDTATNIVGLSVNDVDSASLTVILEASNGRMNDGSGLREVITLTGTAAQINAILSQPGGIGFVPNQDFKGPASVTITVSDGTEQTVQVLPITVNSVNDAPTAISLEPVAVNEGAVKVLSLSNIFAEDVDNQSLTLTINVTTPPAIGRIALASAPGTAITTFTALQLASGQVVYVHDGSETTTSSFVVRVADPLGAQSAPLTVAVAITPVNDAPVVPTLAATTTNEDAAPVVLSLLAGVTDPDGGAARVASFEVAADNGRPVAASLNPATGELTIDPAQFNALQVGQTVTLTVNYAVTDGDAVVMKTTTVTVNGANDAPVATAGTQALTATEDDAFMFTLPAGTFTDVDGDTLTYSLVGAPAWMSINTATGVISGTPANGDVTPAPETFTVQAVDGNGGTVTKTFTVAVANANDAPMLTGAPAVLAAGTEDTAYSITTASLLAGFTDADVGDVLSISGLTASNGTLTAVAGGWTFTPNANFNGTVNLTYNVVDGKGGVTPASTSFAIAAVNDLPTVASSAFSGNEDTEITGKLPEGFDVETASTALSYQLVPGSQAGIAGTLTVNGNGTFSFTPAANLNGTATFQYTVTDANTGVSTAATATITVNAVNDAPTVPTIGAGNTNEDAAVYTIDLLAGITDIDGPAASVASYEVSSSGGKPVAASLAGGILSINPAQFNGLKQGENVTLTITYAVTDGETVVPRTTTLNVSGLNDAPVVTGPVILPAMQEDGAPITITAAQLLAGSSDADNDALTIVGLTATSGTMVNNLNGSWTYTPAANFNGNVTFNYGVSDGIAAPVPQTGVMTITPTPDGPTDITVAGLLETNEFAANGTVVGVVTGVSPDVGAVFSYSLVSNPNNMFSINGVTGQVTVADGLLLDFEQAALAPITIRVTDNLGRFYEEAFNVTVKDINPENIVGDLRANVLVGGALADTLDGGLGNDTLFGGAGSDNILGNSGNDSLFGQGGNDQIDGGDGDDTILGGDGDDNILAGIGNDTVLGGNGADSINGGSGNDVLNGEAGADSIVGSFGDDVLIGGDGNDSLNGGIGNDSIYGDLGNDVAIGEDGNDIFVMGGGDDHGFGGNGNDYFYMGEGNDIMSGGAGVDVLLGEGGNDWLDGGTGVDYYFGGTGNDVFIVRGGEGPKVINDWNAGDLVRIENSAVRSFSDVVAATTDYGNFCIVTLDATTNIWLIGRTSGTLTAADFTFG